MEFNEFSSIKIGLASPEMMRDKTVKKIINEQGEEEEIVIKGWSYGEVTKPETINYRTLKPEKDGLFCEAIFGPTKDWECHCGKYKKIHYKGRICEKCHVEITKSKVRRERMGHIELAAPVSHIWYFKGIPSRMALMLDDITPRNLEQVLYFAKYIVTYVKPNSLAEREIKKQQILTETEYREFEKKYGNDFEALMGAEAVQKLLAEIDLEEQSKKLKAELENATGQKKIKLLKRLEVVESFRLSGNRPEWMILNVLPVIPPDIRPMVQLDGGRFATSDLNDLYRRVINRNNRLKRLNELHAPKMIIRNEKRMLQEAVDAIIDNGRRGKPVTGPSNRSLKSLSDMLKGKQGRFRQNLLGKRVDYSGRSVIVVGPELKMYQCGLPKEMALELFKPFVMKILVESNTVANIKAARKAVERAQPEVWDALERVIKGHPVMLNRAPTLHRLGIQAFEPVLVEGKALKLHPLACTAFNADFDGDQMAVHVPLSAEAQAEARFLMLAANNLLKPSDGKPVTVPTQDMVLGSYYLTLDKDGEMGEGKIFRDTNEVIMAYQTGVIDLHAKVKVRREGIFNGKKISRLIDTTVGRIIFNRPIPQDLGYVDRTKEENFLKYEIDFLVGKKQLGVIIDKCIKKHGTQITSQVLDEVKAQGYKYSTKGAITVAVCDATIPPKKKEIIAAAEQEIDKVTKMYKRGFMSNQERYAKVISIWETATNDVTDALKKNLDRYNPIYMMADSGARGSMSQIRQLAGMRGLIANTSGKTIEIPIRANYREGLNILEYFISSRGARKGLADTALRTADSGYLTRRLVDVSQDVIIREEDCGTKEGIVVYDIRQASADTGEEVSVTYENLVGNHLFENFYDPDLGTLLIPTERIMTKADVDTILAANITDIRIRPFEEFRSMRSCIVGQLPAEDIVDSTTGDIIAGKNCVITETDADNIIRAGIASVNIKTQVDGTGEAIVKTYVSFDKSLKGRRLIDNLYDDSGNVLIPARKLLTENDIQILKNIKAVSVKVIHSNDGDSIIESMHERLQGRYLCEDYYDPQTGKLLVSSDKIMDDHDADLIVNSGATSVKLRSILDCRAKHGVCRKCYGSNLANGMPVTIGEAVGIIAAQSIGEPGTQLTMRTFHTGGVAGGEDITQGLPRVEELFEARKPKHIAIITEISGQVRLEDRNAVITSTDLTENDEPLSKTYLIPFGARTKVKNGQMVEAGDLLTEGSVDPHEILNIKGAAAVQDYLIEEVQSAYRLQGVDINDKHIEVIVRQMMKKVRIEDAGSTDLLPGSLVDKGTFYAANEEIEKRMADGEEGLTLATFSPTLLGITKASLATDSFLSAASFQETTRVLTDAAIKGKVDPLMGLKENVLIGKLVPAGTGMPRYRDVEIEENVPVTINQDVV